jgi:hypothetical protein
MLHEGPPKKKKKVESLKHPFILFVLAIVVIFWKI